MKRKKESRPRERQAIWCCGRCYQRWRFAGTAFPNIIQRCNVCDQPLNWPEYTGPKSPQQSSLEYYYRQRNRHLLSGRTSHGKTRVRADLRIGISPALPEVGFVIEEIDAAAGEIAKSFDLLPPNARDAMRTLAATLIRLRKMIVKTQAVPKPAPTI